MAGQVSKEKLGSVLMQAMLAAKNIRPQRDRLLQLRRRFQKLSTGDDDDAAGLLQEHHIPRCIELLVGERPPNVTGEAPRVSSMRGYSDDPVAAAMEHIAKNGLPSLDKPTPAAASTRKAKGKAPQETSSIDVDQALTYLHRACSLASLAVSHIDLAVAVFSGFLHAKKVASLSDFTDKRAYISEDGRYPSD